MGVFVPTYARLNLRLWITSVKKDKITFGRNAFSVSIHNHHHPELQ
jgi:hypothetical protein